MRMLFVDDETAVLEGLERGLMDVVDESCELAFAASGVEALGMMASQHFDVVVTDMRMPSMDGAAFLEQVQSLYPETVRLVLSGQMDPDTAVRATVHAHQFMSKPSTAKDVYAVATTSFAMRTRLDCEAFRRAVGSIDRLPVVPEVVRELDAELRKPETSVRRIAAIVEGDAALAMKLLQLANSAFFGCGRKVTSVGDAVGRIGTGLVRALAMTGAFASDRVHARELEGFQRHGLAVGVQARALLPAHADAAFTAGLLVECGSMVIAMTAPEDYVEVQIYAKTERVAIHVAEQAVWGVDHAAIGEYLLALWGLPGDIVDAVARHHADPAQGEWSPVSAAVRRAVDLVDGRASAEHA
jgi:HD-like signal output (HDOD) protein